MILGVGRRVRMRHLLAAAAALPPPASVLDAGCGDASVAARLALLWPAAEVLGVDVDPNVLARGRRTAAVLPNLELKLGGVGDEEPSGVFDIVVCTDVLEHIADDRAAFRWLADRVRPGGSLILHVPGAPQRHLFRGIDTALAREVAAGRGPHLREGYGAHELAANVSATGLRVTRVAATFHNLLVRLAEDVDTMLFARRLRPVKALLLPLLLTAASFERRARTGRRGYGLLLCAQKDDA